MLPSITDLILEFADRTAAELGARAVMIYADVCENLDFLKIGNQRYDLILVTREAEKVPPEWRKKAKILSIPPLNLTRVGEMKIAITKSISLGYLQKGDKVVCLSGVPRFGYIDSILIIDVGREFEILTSEFISDIFEGIYPEVFEEVLNIALELGSQGREGRSVGTIFVIGDHERVLQLSRQIVMNPFSGYDETDRNIMLPGLKDTIKEFSAIDGAFILKGNGVILSAGRHLNVALEGRDFPKGLGSRHIAAAGITNITDAVAIVVSESTGTVRVLKKGRIFVSIEKPIE